MAVSIDVNGNIEKLYHDGKYANDCSPPDCFDYRHDEAEAKGDCDTDISQFLKDLCESSTFHLSITCWAILDVGRSCNRS